MPVVYQFVLQVAAYAAVFVAMGLAYVRIISDKKCPHVVKLAACGALFVAMLLWVFTGGDVGQIRAIVGHAQSRFQGRGLDPMKEWKERRER